MKLISQIQNILGIILSYMILITALLPVGFLVLLFRKQKSLLFVHPDYHCSFLLRDALTEKGWHSSIHVDEFYREELLYSQNNIHHFTLIKPRIFGRPWHVIMLFFYITQFKYYFYYGNLDIVPMPTRWLQNFVSPSFQMDAFLIKLFGGKTLFIPTGCVQVETREIFLNLIRNICAHCGWKNRLRP